MERIKNKKDKISFILIVTIFIIACVAFFGKFVYAADAVRATSSSANYTIPGYITYEEYISDPLLLCTGHGIAMPGYNSTAVSSGSLWTHTTDQGLDTGYLTVNDLALTTIGVGAGYTDLAATTSRTYAYYTVATEYDASPAEAYVLAELDNNVVGNGVTLNVTSTEYTALTAEQIENYPTVTVDGTTYRLISDGVENTSGENITYVQEVNGKYYVVEVTNGEGSGAVSSVQYAWWAVNERGLSTITVSDNSLATEAREFEKYINSLGSSTYTSDRVFDISYPVSMTNDDVEVLYDSENNVYKIGPFSVSYLRYIVQCGDREIADFSGITGSELVGVFYDDEGNRYTQTISTENYRFVYEHNHSDYCTNDVDVSDITKVDSTHKYYPYPYDDEEFYIELDYIDDLSALDSFNFDFHYWNGGGSYTMYSGTYLTIYWNVVSVGALTAGSSTAYANDSNVMFTNYTTTTSTEVEELSNNGATIKGDSEITLTTDVLSEDPEIEDYPYNMSEDKLVTIKSVTSGVIGSDDHAGYSSFDIQSTTYSDGEIKVKLSGTRNRIYWYNRYFRKNNIFIYNR